jgi:hypothetical protein
MEMDINNNIENLRNIYRKLPLNKKDNLLHTAQQLLKIQNNDVFPIFVEKSFFKMKRTNNDSSY